MAAIGDATTAPRTDLAGAKRTPIIVVGVLIAAALVMGGVAISTRTTTAAETQAAVGQIYQLQAAFHRAKTTQDIDLMMSLWAPDSVLHNSGKDYRGADTLRAYWLSTGSFKEHRFSLVPSFKEVIQPNGDTAYLYFECHDVSDFGQSARTIVNDTFLAGTVRNVNGKWLFSDMTAGAAGPLSIETYYFKP